MSLALPPYRSLHTRHGEGPEGLVSVKGEGRGLVGVSRAARSRSATCTVAKASQCPLQLTFHH